MGKGLHSFASFGAIAGVTRKTLYEWVEQYPEFAEAKGLAELHSMLGWERKLLDAMDSPQKGWPLAGWIYTMKCRFRKYGYNELEEGSEDEDDLSKESTERLLKIVKR